MTKIEEVARAIYERNSKRKNYVWPDDVYPAIRNRCLNDARAAIEALREPSEKMREAGNNYEGVDHTWGPSRGGAGEYIANSGGVFTAMIDAILSEGK